MNTLHRQFGRQFGLRFWRCTLLLLLFVNNASHSQEQAQVTDTFSTALTAYQARDFDQAFPLFLELAKQGSAQSQTIVAIMYRYGEGVTPDAKVAYNWYTKAARAGYAPAQFSLANMLIDGDGIPKNEESGLYWMREAAASGHLRAAEYLVTSGPVEAPSEDADWSRKWDLRLPNDIRYGDQAAIGYYRAEIGGFESLAIAEQRWQAMLRNFSGALATLTPDYVPSFAEEDADILMQIGTFGSPDDAHHLCEQLLPTPCRVVFR